MAFNCNNSIMVEPHTAPINPPFRKPRCLQQASPLLQLPFELRLKVWRYLFKAGRPLTSMNELVMTQSNEGFPCHNYRRPGTQLGGNEWQELRPMGELLEEYRKDIQLSSQFLRTCQQIYTEGQGILYPENTLRVYSQEAGRFGLLDMSVHMGQYVEYLPRYQFNLLEMSIDKAYNRPDEGSSHENRKLRSVYPSLDKFGHYQVVIDIGSTYVDECTPPVQVACRVLASLLQNHHVSLCFMKEGERLFAKDVPLLELNARYLRCKTVHFEGPITDEIAKLQCLITSKHQAQDIVEAYHSVKECLSNSIFTITNTFFEFDQFESEEEKSVRNSEGSDKLKDRLLNCALEANEELTQTIIQDANTEKARRVEEIYRIFDSATYL